MPAELLPQLVSVLDVHVVSHQLAWQVPAVQAAHGEGVASLQGSPMSPFVPAQINSDAFPTVGWQVVPEMGEQSAFVEHPGKQMYSLLPFSTQ
jgi:hypothetical protein